RARRITSREKLLGRVAGSEKTMRTNAKPVDGRHDVTQFRLLQCVVQPGDRPRRVAECRMDSDIFDSLSIEIDSTVVPQTLQILGARHQFIANRAFLR